MLMFSAFDFQKRYFCNIVIFNNRNKWHKHHFPNKKPFQK